MTIPVQETGYSQYTGTGSRTYFEFGFETLEGGTVYVLVDRAVPQFVIQENGVVITPAPPLGSVVEIYRWTDVDQLRDWVTFDSFNAAWTEDAADKLIMLKSEGWYRGAMNMISVPFLNRVELQQDKGDNAILWTWNERVENDVVINEAGVFAGEVLSSEDAPEPGTYVEKPDDFAYFMWGAGTSEQSEILTTTLYPLEEIDGIEFTVDLLAGAMRAIPNDDAAHHSVFIGGDIRQIRLEQTVPGDDAAHHSVFVGGDIRQIRLEQTVPGDQASHHSVFIGGDIRPKLITIYAPDDGIEMTVDLFPANCHMTPV